MTENPGLGISMSDGDKIMEYLKVFDNKPLNLTILQEECAELIQIASKILRFGESEDKLAQLVQEIGDVMAMIDIVAVSHKIYRDRLIVAHAKKVSKLKKFYDREDSRS